MTEHSDAESHHSFVCATVSPDYFVSIYPDELLRDELMALTANLVLPPSPPQFDPLADFKNDEEKEQDAREEEARRHITRFEALIGIENRMLELLRPTKLRFHLHPAKQTEWAIGLPVVEIVPFFTSNQVAVHDAAAILEAFNAARTDVVAALQEVRRETGLN